MVRSLLLCTVVVVVAAAVAAAVLGTAGAGRPGGACMADGLRSNIVRRRPPENRTPTKEEVDFYKPFVLEELRLVDPQVVVLAGAVAMQTLLSETRGITKVRGQWYERDGRLYMPWLHPSYLLRRPTKSKGGPKWLTWMDVKEVRRKYDELGCPHPARARGPRPGVLGGDRGGGKGHGDST